MYKLQFNDFELNKFNIIENEKKRKSLMSIYMYLLKINNYENERHIEADLQSKKDKYKLKISFRNFLKKYSRYHEKISIYTLKSRIDTLKNLGLILSEKIKNSFLYSFIRYIPNKKANKKPNKKNPAQSIENTSLQEDYEKPKYTNLKNKNNNYINNSVPQSFQGNFIKSIKEIKHILNTYIEKYSIISPSAINEIYRRLRKIINQGELRFSGTEKYIRLTINSIRNYFIPQLIRQANLKDNNNPNQSNKNIKQGSFNDYTQREYDYEKLEKKLLGWECD